MATSLPLPSNHYSILGVDQNATEDELRRARNRLARQVHPDKNQSIEDSATKLMQKVNEAYRVLSDRVQRRSYDMTLEDGDQPSGTSIPLPPGRRFSEYLSNEFHKWMLKSIRVLDDTSNEGFIKALQNSMNEFLEHFDELNNKCFVDQPVSMKEQSTPSLNEQILHSGLSDTVIHRTAKNQACRQISKTDTEQLQKVQKVLHHARTRKNETLPVMLRDGAEVPIVDFSHDDMPCEELMIVLSLFVDKVSSYWTKQKLLKHLAMFIPVVKVTECPQSQSCWLTTKHNVCIACTCELSFDTDFHLLRMPRRGLLMPQQVCDECCKHSYEEDMQDWVLAGFHCLEQEEPNVRGAMGCFYMAECSRAPGIQHQLTLSRKALQSGSPEVALPFLFDVVERSTDAKDKVRPYLLASKALQDLASHPDATWYERWLLLHSAHSATAMARHDSLFASNVFDEVGIQTKMKTIESDICQLEKQIKEQEVNQKAKQIYLALEQAWGSRNWEKVLEIVMEETDQGLQKFSDEGSCLAEALQSFMKGLESYLHRMVLEDRVAVHFLRGVLKLLQHQVKSGLADIQIAAWNGFAVGWVPLAVIHQVLSMLPQQPDAVLPICGLLKACKELASGADILNDSDAIFPAIKDLDVNATELQWPEIELVGYSTMGLYKYEQSVNKQLREGKWAEHDAALAYLDLIPACNHPAEVAVCFLTASAWLLKELQCMSKKYRKKANEQRNLYALKNAVFWCLNHAMATTHLSLHPGMKLYVSRFCIGVALRVSHLASTVMTEEEGKKIVQWVEVYAYNCRQCPFWQTPTVMVCEAVLLNLISGRLHSTFVAGMLRLEPKYRPISLSELHYQLYENDLRIHHLESTHAKSRAMLELLNDKGWYFEDVGSLLSSFLSPRSDEGWLMAQPEFCVDMEYAALNGIVVNIEEASRFGCAVSVHLMVEPADASKGRPGLFSQKDINTALRLSSPEASYFSLDQPNINQCFHPFQEMRYSPSELAGTEFLQTMLETDYLLKSFSIGSDISSKPPFNQRPCAEGLTADLPPYLQAALKPVSERGYRCSHVNRFWIQADEVTYECDESAPEINMMKYHYDQDGIIEDPYASSTVNVGYLCWLSATRIEFRLSVPKMSVRTHPLLPGADGKLKDSSIDLDPESAEAKFAKDLTKNYDKLSHYFPVFGRLKELARLQLVSCLLKNVATGLEQTAKTTRSYSEFLRNVPWTHHKELEKQIQDSHEMKFTAFKGHVDALCSAASYATQKHEDNPCIWVPAALRKVEREETLELSYGGVILAPKVKSGSVPKRSGNISVVLTGERIRSCANYKPRYTAPRRMSATRSASKHDAVPKTMAYSSGGNRSGTSGSATQRGSRGGHRHTVLTQTSSRGGESGGVKPTTSRGGGSGGVKPTSSSGGGSGGVKPTSSSGGGSRGVKPTSSRVGGSGGVKPTSSSGGGSGGVKPTSSSGGGSGGVKPTSSSGVGSGGVKPTSSSGVGSGGVMPTSSSGGGSGGVKPTSSSGVGSGGVKPTSSSGGGSGGVKPTSSSGGGSGGVKPTSSSGGGSGGVKPTSSSGGGSGGVKPTSSSGGGSGVPGGKPPSPGGGDSSGGGNGRATCSSGAQGGGTQNESNIGRGIAQGGQLKLSPIYQAPKPDGNVASVLSAKKMGVGCDAYKCTGPVHPNMKRHGYLLMMTKDEAFLQFLLTGRDYQNVSIIRNMQSTELVRERHHPLCKACLCVKRTETNFARCSVTGEIHSTNIKVDAHCPSLCQLSRVVYLATCKFTGKQYVGITKNTLRERIGSHRNDVNSALNLHWKSQHVPGNLEFHEVFDFEVLEHTSRVEDLRKLEAFYIQRFLTYVKGLNRRPN